MDKLLEKCGSKFTGERAMDSNEHEKERGITITSKYTRLYYKEYTLHVVDTPGHAGNKIKDSLMIILKLNKIIAIL
jgi:GTP-binding protein